MRLIDADELKKLRDDYIQGRIEFDGDEYDMIDKCPTIEAEPVAHGRWEHLGGDEWYCTNCGEVISTEGSWDKPTYKHCHECGAKMDGERRDNNAAD